MDDRTRSLIVTTIVLLIIIGLVAGAIFYISNLIRSRQKGIVSNNSPRSTVVSSPTQKSLNRVENGLSTTTPAPEQIPSGKKIFKGEGFQFLYPSNFGVLRCNNSKNFELDPVNTKDETIACDVALKPITILVGSSNCPTGESIDKGGVNFTKVKTETEDGVDYKWCTKTTPSLEISHRVSSTGSRATSKEDYSPQIEEIISTLKVGIST